MSRLLMIENLVREDALLVIADDRSGYKANLCAKELLEALQELAVFAAQVKAKDEQIAEMSSLWREIRKAEAA